MDNYIKKNVAYNEAGLKQEFLLK